ncbi:hypothetical protein [Vibrio gazogenes]|uniref:Uncharacterized protein n=1 Tax=Vibrio gazogenes TaxID=687 RepID=A0A1Z2SL02_VIBGA|nr:hypothetical protein [Vibrio gazogenes]ASA57815.1 hypothetical protein BSQ33_18975 [Vibrio gazogenes]
MFRLFLLVLALLPISSMAGNGSKGKVTLIEFMGNGVILFRHTGAHTAIPTCVGNNFRNRWAIDAKTDAGKAQLSGLLTAYSAGKDVTVIGANSCSLWGDTETVKYFYISG